MAAVWPPPGVHASFVVGYVKLDFKGPDWSWLWVLTNLLFVCVAEEALFRGFIQEQLSQIFRSQKNGSIWALRIAAILFGLAHFKGGWILVGLAIVAGVFYGLAYKETRRVEAPILTHFAFNLIHFVAFTYPALRP